MSQRSKHEQLHRGTAITMSVYDERFRSLILPSKSSMNAPYDSQVVESQRTSQEVKVTRNVGGKKSRQPQRYPVLS